MEQQELKDQVLHILDDNKFGTLATVKKNKPHSRYMTFHHDGFTLFTPTDKQTHKAEEIDDNPYVHILLGYNGEGLGDAYVEVEGKAVIKEDNGLKEKCWTGHMDKWFDGPNDPNYIILEIQPTLFRLMNTEANSPQVLEL